MSIPSSRVTTDGNATLDLHRLARDFETHCRWKGRSLSASAMDIGIDAATVTRLRKGKLTQMHSLTLLLICHSIGANPMDYLVFDQS